MHFSAERESLYYYSVFSRSLYLKEKLGWKSPLFTFFLKKWRDAVRKWEAWLSSLVASSTTNFDWQQPSISGIRSTNCKAKMQLIENDQEYFMRSPFGYWQTLVVYGILNTKKGRKPSELFSPGQGNCLGLFASKIRRRPLLKYYSSDQIFNDLVSGEVKRHVIYASMQAAKSRGYTDRMEMFQSAIIRYDQHRRENTN